MRSLKRNLYLCIILTSLVMLFIFEKNNQESQAYKEEDTLSDGRKPKSTSYRYFLTAVILVRIYSSDKAEWSREYLYQWVRYMQYAGVEHVYLYDNYRSQNESLEVWCRDHFSSQELTYTDWSMYSPYTMAGTQITAYNHAQHIGLKTSQWQIRFDMDEYPFAEKHTERRFLTHFLHNQMDSNPTVCEFSIKNFLFLGKRGSGSLILEQFLRRTPDPSNDLSKPIFKPVCVRKIGVHHNAIESGRRMEVPPSILRMNHYWGGRLQNWGEDTAKVLRKTLYDASALEMAEKLKEYL